MAMLDGQLPRLEGLLALSRSEGVDIRPTLARVLTDLYLASCPPIESDTVRYVELLRNLLPQIDTETRLIIAEKLGPSADAPTELIEMLLADEPPVAAAVLATSAMIAPASLWARLDGADRLVLTAIAARPDLDLAMVRAIAARRMTTAAEALSANPRAPIDRSVVENLALTPGARRQVALSLASRPGIDHALLAPLALELPPEQRRALVNAYIADPRRRAIGREPRLDAPQLILQALETTALAGDTDAFDQHLAALFDVEASAIEPLVACPDLLAMALTAIGMPSDQAIRTIMFACPTTGRSVTAIREIDALLQDANRVAATRLVRAALNAPTPPPVARHLPVLTDSTPPNRLEPQPGAAAETERRDRTTGTR